MTRARTPPLPRDDARARRLRAATAQGSGRAGARRLSVKDRELRVLVARARFCASVARRARSPVGRARFGAGVRSRARCRGSEPGRVPGQRTGKTAAARSISVIRTVFLLSAASVAVVGKAWLAGGVPVNAMTVSSTVDESSAGRAARRSRSSGRTERPCAPRACTTTRRHSPRSTASAPLEHWAGRSAFGQGRRAASRSRNARYSLRASITTPPAGVGCCAEAVGTGRGKRKQRARGTPAPLKATASPCKSTATRRHSPPRTASALVERRAAHQRAAVARCDRARAGTAARPSAEASGVRRTACPVWRARGPCPRCT